MKLVDSIVYADKGKYLFVKPLNEYFKMISLGTRVMVSNGIITKTDITLDNITEGFLVNDLFIEATDYEDLVTKLIRTKYSLDQELALQSNLRLDPEGYNLEELKFQNWRIICKQLAKHAVNE